MNPYKLTFKLKQHTPIIHFQHEQHGATLRASELKPKLDKFLIEKFEQEGIEYKQWLVGKGEHPALDYKIKICVPDSKRYLLGFPRKQYIKNDKNEITNYKLLWDDQFPNYFGNMKKEGEEKEPKEFLLNKKLIDGEIIVFNSDLRKIISNSLIEFFFMNNFGTRQNKGFGSFGVVEIDGEKKNLHENNNDYPSFTIDLSSISMSSKIYEKNNSTYLPNVLKSKKEELKTKFNNLLKEKLYEEEEEIQFLFKIHNLFHRIELFYKTLRSGINIPNRLYFKSLMFQYAKRLTPSQQWDKRTIREHFYENFSGYKNLLSKPYSNESTLKFSPNGEHEKDKLLFRDLLGLSSLQQWKYYNNDTITKEGKAKINNQVTIQRYKSPITFKPIQIKDNLFRVFIFCETIPDEYLSEEIKITSTQFAFNNPLTLKLPDEFDVCKYIYDSVTLYILQDNLNSENYDNHFKQYVSNSNSEEANYLLDIFSQLNDFYLSREEQ